MGDEERKRQLLAGQAIRQRGFAPEERDYQLGDGDWRGRLGEGWAMDDRPFAVPHREVPASPLGEKDLREHILRFPSAPLHHTNRLVEHQLQVQRNQPLFHTYRILTATDFEGPAQTVYLLHHGLNEVDDMGFFYDFASNLFAGDAGRRAICIVRPFPSHLTRHPFHGPFTQAPLDRYLTDAGDLVRQFLRYMIETRWMLSVLAPLTSYHTPIGLDLLCAPAQQPTPATEGTDPLSRHRDRDLAEAMRTEWLRLRSGSQKAREHRQRAPQSTVEPPELPPFERAVADLRRFVGVPTSCDATDQKRVGDAIDAANPRIHVVGYSLGGFVAQSIFFAWPYLIGGCTTLLSGGALRSLTPTAFANPEEWQTVLHALRYELDWSLLDGGIARARPEPGLTAGVPDQHFEAMLRVFYDVFEQESRNAYQSRVDEFSRRLLFVVGGSDEIVRTQSVIDAGPAGAGINLLQIANLSHFLGRRASGVEEFQRTFWLPEIGRIARRFSRQADRVRREDLTRAWLVDLATPWPTALEGFSVDDVPEAQTDLPSPQFEKRLDLMVAKLFPPDPEPPGWRPGALFVAQTTTPAFLLGDEGMRERAAALHHSDNAVVAYLAGLRGRASRLLGDDQTETNLCVVLPHAAARWHEERGIHHPARSETLPGLLGSPSPDSRRWSTITGAWGDKLRYFRPMEPGAPLDAEAPDDLGTHIVREALVPWEGSQRAGSHTHLPYPVADLPNLWVWIDGTELKEWTAPQARSSPLSVSLLHRYLLTFAALRRAAESETSTHPSDPHAAATKAYERRLASMAAEGKLICLRISPAHFNPRHRGRLLTRGSHLRKALTFLGLTLAMSVDEPLEVAR